MKSTSRCSGCAPSPWTWSVLHITGVFSVSSQYTIHRSLRHLHCLGNVRYCSPRCFHPNDLPSLADGTFPHDEVKLTGHKKLTFGVAKVVLVSTLLFKDYMVNFTHFCQTCYQVYTHHIDNFSGSHSMSNTMKNKFEKFLQELFSRGVHVSTRYRVNSGRHEIDIHGWYSTVDVNLASICKCKNNRRLRRHSTGVTSLPDVTVCDNYVRHNRMAESYMNDQYPPMSFLVTGWVFIFTGMVAFTTFQTCSL